MATSTPWGAAQSAYKIAPGIMDYSTASHGGIHVSPKVNGLIPDYMRRADGWYEEDCDWCIPVIALTGKIELNLEHIINEGSAYFTAWETLKNWHPEKFERFFKCTLQPGESYLKDKPFK